MLQWENEEVEQEETHQDHQEEEALPLQVPEQHNQLPQQPTLKPWAKIPLSSKGKGKRWTPL